MKAPAHHQSYLQLSVMLILSAVSMYVLMYAMTDELANVYMNLNQFYMAVLMTAPMGLIELAVMRSMYTDRRLNVVVAAASAAVLLASWMAIREQAAIRDDQFLRSMIPHHAGAVLMCERASLTDPELRRLCGSIVEGQQAEIALMKAMLTAPRE